MVGGLRTYRSISDRSTWTKPRNVLARSQMVRSRHWCRRSLMLEDALLLVPLRLPCWLLNW